MCKGDFETGAFVKSGIGPYIADSVIIAAMLVNSKHCCQWWTNSTAVSNILVGLHSCSALVRALWECALVGPPGLQLPPAIASRILPRDRSSQTTLASESMKDDDGHICSLLSWHTTVNSVAAASAIVDLAFMCAVQCNTVVLSPRIFITRPLQPISDA